MFFNPPMEVSHRITNVITCITQATFKLANNALLINHGRFLSRIFSTSRSLIFWLTKTGWIVTDVLRERSLSRFLTISAERWSLNGKTTLLKFSSLVDCGSCCAADSCVGETSDCSLDHMLRVFQLTKHNFQSFTLIGEVLP